MARRDVQLALRRGQPITPNLTLRMCADSRGRHSTRWRSHKPRRNVKLNLPGWQVLPESAVCDRSKAMITVHGDATLVALKPL
jgi:hypothetical protein